MSRWRGGCSAAELKSGVKIMIDDGMSAFFLFFSETIGNLGFGEGIFASMDKDAYL